MDDSPAAPVTETPLPGGRANLGSVVRIGDQVARPAHPQRPHVEDFLRHVRSHGVAIVPEPLGVDVDGRQRLSFIPGRAPTSPYPEWAWTHELLVDVVEGQRTLHAAAADYAPPPDAVWAVNGGDYFPAGSDGTLHCHNDLCLSNVIVDVATGRLAGFVDFDYVAPVTPLFDIAVLARHWTPFGDPDGGEIAELDRVARFRTIVDVHELDTEQRNTVVDLAESFLAQARRNVRALADAGNPGFRQMIDNGYEQTNLATIDWIERHRPALIAR